MNEKLRALGTERWNMETILTRVSMYSGTLAGVGDELEAAEKIRDFTDSWNIRELYLCVDPVICGRENRTAEGSSFPDEMYLLYGIRNGKEYRQTLIDRRDLVPALQEMRREAGGYVRGQSLVALAVALLTAVGLMIVGIPAWLVLGILMGLCEFIPYIGPMIGGIPIVLFSLPLGISATLWALGVTVFVQQIEGYFLSPRLMAGATGLHPVSVILLLSAGGYLGGLIGMVAAVPAFVCVRGAARVLYETREERE